MVIGSRLVELTDMTSLQTLAHYQPLTPTVPADLIFAFRAQRT
jgi:hypothetical protein